MPVACSPARRSSSTGPSPARTSRSGAGVGRQRGDVDLGRGPAHRRGARGGEVVSLVGGSDPARGGVREPDGAGATGTTRPTPEAASSAARCAGTRPAPCTATVLRRRAASVSTPRSPCRAVSAASSGARRGVGRQQPRAPGSAAAAARGSRRGAARPAWRGRAGSSTAERRQPRPTGPWRRRRPTACTTSAGRPWTTDARPASSRCTTRPASARAAARGRAPSTSAPRPGRRGSALGTATGTASAAWVGVHAHADELAVPWSGSAGYPQRPRCRPADVHMRHHPVRPQ